MIFKWQQVEKGKILHGQEPPSEESTTPECGVNCQQLTIIYWSSPMCTEVWVWITSLSLLSLAGCGRLQLGVHLLVTVDHNQLRTIESETVDPINRSHPHPHGQYPLSSTYIARCKRGIQIARLVSATGARTRVHGYARPTHCLCCHSGYGEWRGSRLRSTH